MMKRIRKAIVKTTVLGRNGKSTVQTPLNVTASCSKVSSHGSARVDSFENLEPDNHLEDQFDIDVAAIGDESASMKRNISNFCNWEKVRVSLINASLEEAYMPDNSLCSVCLDQQASIRCQYCGPRQFFCQPCGYKLHENRNQFHVMEQWTENKYVPLFPNHGVIDNGHQCDSKILRLFKLVDAFGNQHLKQVAVCECESHAATLIRAQFWPGSPEKPSIGFHFKLMDLAETLFLHNQVPLKDFSELLLELVPSMQPILIATMYRTLNSGCFDEYRYYKYKLKYLDFFVPSLYNGADCPLCPVENGTVIECIDACFGLIRRKGKGGKSISSRHGSLLFSDQDDVDNFVDNYQHKGPKAVSQDCSRFHAGEVVPALRSKGKNQLFDEKGVFGRVCRHDFPKSFLNIKHGERISYSVYELEKIKESITSKNVKVVLMYDIACILSSHLKGSGREDLLTDVNLAVPIFHCYGHKALCQVKYSPRRTPNVGLTDGEGVERLWSFMRQFSKITKEMSVDKRVDVLTDAAIHYGQHLFARFGTTLKVKYTRTTTLASTVEVEIKSLLLKLPNNVDDATIQQWIVNEISEMTPKQNDLEYQWDELYTELLITARKLRSELIYAQEEEPDRVGILQSKIKRNEKAMGNIEKEHGVRVRWKKGEPSFENAKRRLVEKKRLSLLLALHRIASERIFLLELKAKYAEGQALAIKLANQINRVVTEMNKSLAALNGLTNDESVVFDDIKDPQGDIYRTLTVPNNDGVVPNKIKKRIIELVCLQDRCREELIMVKEEMLVFCNFLRGQINTMSSYVRDNHSSNPQKAGLQCLLLQKVLMYQKHLQSLQIMWGNIVTFQFTETNESTFLLTKPSEITSFLPHDCDCCDDSTNL